MTSTGEAAEPQIFGCDPLLLMSAERSKLRNNEPHGKDVVEHATDWREGRPPQAFALGEK